MLFSLTELKFIANVQFNRKVPDSIYKILSVDPVSISLPKDTMYNQDFNCYCGFSTFAVLAMSASSS